MAENERDFKGVWIPKTVWLDERLNALDKVILIEIDSLDNGERGCYASNKHIAEFCQCSETKVSTAISKLIKLGYLYVQKFDGRQRELKSRLSNFERQELKNCKSDFENLKESNTYNKTNNNKSNKYKYDENFENLWKLLKSTPYDRKSAVTKKRKKELYEMGYERVEKAIKVYQQTQNPEYYFKRDRFFNEIIDNYLNKEVSDIQNANKKSNSNKNDGWCFNPNEEDDLDFIK